MGLLIAEDFCVEIYFGFVAHEVLPLTGVTHMTSQEVVAENLMHLELDFLKRSLKI